MNGTTIATCRITAIVNRDFSRPAGNIITAKRYGIDSFSHAVGRTVLLKEHGRAHIEAVGDLSQLRHPRFEVWILPLKMRGLDSSPIRLIAIEDEEYISTF